MDKAIIDRQLVSDMLYGEETYITEFSTAAIESFEEFISDYSKYMIERDLENLRRAGHKIKPVAQMLRVNELVDEYEYAKSLLNGERSGDELNGSVNRMEKLCKQVIDDFRQILSSNG